MLRMAAWCLALIAAVSLGASDAHGRAVAIQADPAHSGDAGDAGLPAQPSRRWVHRVDGHPSYAIIADGRVFVTVSLYDRTDELVALAVRDGRTLWRMVLPDPIGTATLAYDDGRVFVAGPGLFALDGRDGSLLWRFEAVPISDGAPVAADGVVYADSNSWSGVAVRQSDGALLWRGPRYDGHDATGAVAGDRIFFLEGPCELSGLRRADGLAAFLGEDLCRTASLRPYPAVHAGRVYVPLGSRRPGTTNVFDAASGAARGAIPFHHAPAFRGDVGIFPDGRRAGETEVGAHALVARRLTDGRRLWRFRGDGYLDSPPLIAGRRVYVGSGSGRVYGLALGSGRVRWRADVGAPVEGVISDSGLAAAEGILVVPAHRRVVAFG